MKGRVTCLKLLNQKLENLIKLSEEGTSKDKIDQKLGLLHKTTKLLITKEKFLKEMESATPVNTWMLRKRNNLHCWYGESFSGLGGDQTSQNIPLSQSLIKIKALTLFTSVKAERGKEAAEEKFVANRGWFMMFEERKCFCNIKVQGKIAGADVEAAASYLENLTKIIHEGSYAKNQIFNVDEIAFYWKKIPSRTYS